MNKAKAASLLVGERLSRLLIGFFVHAWIARSFTPEEFGFINYVVKGVAIYFTFGLFGTDEVIMSELVNKDKSSQKDVLKTTLIIRLLFGFTGWIIMSVLTGIVSGFGSETWIWMTIYGVTIPLQAFAVYEIPLVLNLEIKNIFYARNGSYLLGIAAKSGSLLLNSGKQLFALIYAVEEFFWKIFVTLLAFKSGLKGGVYQQKIASLILKPSLVAFIAAFLTQFDQRLPFLFLEYFTDSAVIGQYSIMISLLDIAILVPISLATAMFPSVVKGMHESHESYKLHRLEMSKWLIRLGIALSILGSVFAPIGIRVLYGGKYTEIIPLFQIFIFSLVFYFFNIGRFKWFVLEGALREWTYLLIAGIIIQSLSLAILVPKYGLQGVVWAVFIGQILPNLILIRFKVVRESMAVLFQSFKL